MNEYSFSEKEKRKMYHAKNRRTIQKDERRHEGKDS